MWYATWRDLWLGIYLLASNRAKKNIAKCRDILVEEGTMDPEDMMFSWEKDR